MDELKPCPFCGGDAILVNRKNETGEDRTDVYDVECRTTGCWLQYGADWWVTKNKAISMWNTRAETPIEKAARGVAERLRRLGRCPQMVDGFRVDFVRIVREMADKLEGKQ